MDHQSKPPATRDYFLKPGYIYLPEKPTAISAVVGSSVVLALYDKKKKCGGMNHFLFPRIFPGQSPSSRFGNVAVVTLIRMMKKRGCKSTDLKAQIFGGAFDPQCCEKNVGLDCVNVARKILKQKDIRLVSEDVGGELGRKIVFNTATCELAVIKVDRLRESDWYPYPESR